MSECPEIQLASGPVEMPDFFSVDDFLSFKGAIVGLGRIPMKGKARWEVWSLQCDPEQHWDSAESNLLASGVRGNRIRRRSQLPGPGESWNREERFPNLNFVPRLANGVQDFWHLLREGREESSAAQVPGCHPAGRRRAAVRL